MIDLTPIQKDCLQEVFNIGIGKAAESLSDLVSEEIILSIPRVLLTTSDGASEQLGLPLDTQICAIGQFFKTDTYLAGVNLIFTEQKSLELVKIFLNRETPIEELSDLEEDALKEIGNIILNSFIGSIANILNTEFETSLPAVTKENVKSIFSDVKLNDNDFVIAAYVDFSITSREIRGYLVLTFDSALIEEFINNLLNSLMN